MPTFYITEYQTAASDQGRALPLGHGFPVAKQTLPIGSQVQSAPFSKFTRFVRFHSDSVCSFLVGVAAGGGPVATTADSRMAANQTEYFGVDPGMMVSVIANT